MDNKKKVVFFGRRFEANQWANKNKRQYRDVILGTSSEELLELNHYPIIIIDDTWKPTPEEKPKALRSLEILDLMKIIHEEPAAA